MSPSSYRSAAHGGMVILVLQLFRRKFSHRNFVADFTRLKLNFLLKETKNRVLSHPLGDSLSLSHTLISIVGKPVVDFLFVIIELI